MPGWFQFRRRGANSESGHADLASIRYVVLDTELTSLDSRRNRMLSIGAVAMEGTKIRLNQQFYRVVNPGVAVPASGVPIHGLRPCDVESGEPSAKVLDEFRSFVGSAILVGHFASIDLKVLRKELGDGGWLDNPAICTARIEHWILRHGPRTEDLVHRLENLDLVSLAKAYDLDFHERHHALEDAFVTARLWQKMIHVLAGLGVGDLNGLLRIGRV
jgi:DNA polymerase-3 subunit epsilon